MSDITTLVAAAAHALAVLAPPARLAALPAAPRWVETAEARQERYQHIAEAAVRVAFDPKEHALYGGKLGRQRTLGLLLGTAWIESGFAPDVDLGPCWHGLGGKTPRCDGDKSVCVLQIQVGAGTTTEGWDREALFGDREKCFRAGLHLMKRSFYACHKYGGDHLLDAYAAGICDGVMAHAKSAQRLGLGRKAFELVHDATHQPDAAFFDDSGVYEMPAGAVTSRDVAAQVM